MPENRPLQAGASKAVSDTHLWEGTEIKFQEKLLQHLLKIDFSKS